MTTPGPTVYLDHAATTPILPVALDAMTAQLAAVGNANSLHASGRSARRVVEEARETIARSLGCRPGDVVFTSGGTEADNLALKGIFWARRGEDARRVARPGPRRGASSRCPPRRAGGSSPRRLTATSAWSRRGRGRRAVGS